MSWKAVNKSRPCPICGHTSWCRVSPDGVMAWCGRESRGSLKASKGGFLHRLRRDDDAAGSQAHRRPTPPLPSWSAAARASARPKPTVDFAALARQWVCNVDVEAARRLADELQVNVTSLRRLGLGWAPAAEIHATGTKCRGRGCWTFPMSDGAGRTVGIRLRTEDSFKYGLLGSDGQGLFIPKGLAGGGLLLLPEGPTSAAALLVMNFNAVGRPNCRAGVDYLRALVTRLRPTTCIVIGDNDQPDKFGRRAGQEAAPVVASALAGYCRDVRSLLPPAEFKDTRVWLAGGADRADVLNRLRMARPCPGARGKEVAASA